MSKTKIDKAIKKANESDSHDRAQDLHDKLIQTMRDGIQINTNMKHLDDYVKKNGTSEKTLAAMFFWQSMVFQNFTLQKEIAREFARAVEECAEVHRILGHTGQRELIGKVKFPIQKTGDYDRSKIGTVGEIKDYDNI